MSNISSTTEDSNTARRDLHQYVTDTIIQQLETGNIPWQKPWQGKNHNPFSLPCNVTTGKKYQGINILMLWISSMNNDFPTSNWASFKQWKSKEEFVRKGEKGTTIVYYDTFEKEVDGEIKKIPFLKSSIVFNQSQLQSYKNQQPKDAPPFSERLPMVENFVDNTGVVLEHRDSGGAYYVPKDDKIIMPFPETFIDTERRTRQEGYYSVMMHELTHWTGHEKRLNRKFGKSFGNETYAVEELVAELGAAFLCAELNITNEIKQDHASYIAHWLNVIKENKQHIIKSASEASKATQYLHSLQNALPSPVPVS